MKEVVPLCLYHVILAPYFTVIGTLAHMVNVKVVTVVIVIIIHLHYSSVMKTSSLSYWVIWWFTFDILQMEIWFFMCHCTEWSTSTRKIENFLKTNPGVVWFYCIFFDAQVKIGKTCSTEHKGGSHFATLAHMHTPRHSYQVGKHIDCFLPPSVKGINMHSQLL